MESVADLQMYGYSVDNDMGPPMTIPTFDLTKDVEVRALTGGTFFSFPVTNAPDGVHQTETRTGFDFPISFDQEKLKAKVGDLLSSAVQGGLNVAYGAVQKQLNKANQGSSPLDQFITRTASSFQSTKSGQQMFYEGVKGQVNQILNNPMTIMIVLVGIVGLLFFSIVRK